MRWEYGRARREAPDSASLVVATRAAIERAQSLLAESERTDAALIEALHAARRAVAASRLARALRGGTSGNRAGGGQAGTGRRRIAPVRQ
jgi:hypothetical protein